MNRIYFLRGTDLVFHATLATTMFRDRQVQFKQRLGWEVHVDADGYERDEYDTENPIYVVIEQPNGAHAGSLRLLPTTGRTMINDHFLEAVGGKPLVEPETWECTRFCVSAHADQRTAGRLLAATGRLMKELDILKLAAVFDDKMLRQYRFSGAQPKVIGSASSVEGDVFAGIWSFDTPTLNKLIKRADLDPTELELCLANSGAVKELICLRSKRSESV